MSSRIHDLQSRRSFTRGMVEIVYLTDRRDGWGAQQINITSLGMPVNAYAATLALTGAPPSTQKPVLLEVFPAEQGPAGISSP